MSGPPSEALRFDPTRANALQRLIARWARLCAERRGLALLLLLLVSVAVGAPAGLRLVRGGAPVDFTPQAMFIDTGPEVAQLRLAEQGICVSTGSACSTGMREPSHVLRAMRIPAAYARGTVRFSLGLGTTAEQMDRVATLLPGLVAELRSVMR